MKRKVLSVLFALFLTLTTFIPAEVGAAAPKMLMSEPIGAGAHRYEYEVPLGNSKAFASVVKVDLTNPYAKISVAMGAGTYTQKATVSQMANRTGAVALVNGDFFNMNSQGAPLGASVIDGRLASAPMNSIGYYSLGIDSQQHAFIEQITFGGYVIAANGEQYPIQGLNKAVYGDNITGANSHVHTINLYNDLWTSKSRGRAGSNCVEVLVNSEGIVEDISSGRTLNYAVPEGKIIIQANDRAKTFVKDNIKKGDKINLDYQIRPERDWEVLIGGHGLLVDNGNVIAYALSPSSIDGNRARTAAGISQDGKTLWIAAVEGRTARSKGMRLAELAQFMRDIGCYKAVNLDGGGSTAMAAKSTGEFTPQLVVNPERNGSERYVVNGLGVYNTAPEGPLAEMKLSGPTTLLLGETGGYSVLGWDSNYIAKDMNTLNVSYSDNIEGAANWFGHNKLAAQVGNMVVTASSEGVNTSLNVKVVGSSHVKDTDFTVSTDRPIVTGVGNFNITAHTNGGRKVDINPIAVNMYFEDIEGRIDPSEKTFIVDNYNNKHKGYLVANYDGIVMRKTFFNPDFKQIHMDIDKKDYTIQGQPMKLDTAPIIENNRTLVPLRFLVESFGGEVTWDEELRVVGINYAGMNISIPIGSGTITVNGNPVLIDSPAIIRDNRTLVPIRVISESLGMIVEYNEATRSVDIFENVNRSQNYVNALTSETVSEESAPETQMIELEETQTNETPAEVQPIENNELENQEPAPAV